MQIPVSGNSFAVNDWGMPLLGSRSASLSEWKTQYHLYEKLETRPRFRLRISKVPNIFFIPSISGSCRQSCASYEFVCIFYPRRGRSSLAFNLCSLTSYEESDCAPAVLPYLNEALCGPCLMQIYRLRFFFKSYRHLPRDRSDRPTDFFSWPFFICKRVR